MKIRHIVGDIKNKSLLIWDRDYTKITSAELHRIEKGFHEIEKGESISFNSVEEMKKHFKV